MCDQALSRTSWWATGCCKVCGCYLVCFFLILHLLLFRFLSTNLCCITKCMMKHQQKPYWKLDLLLFSYSYSNHKCLFVDSFYWMKMYSNLLYTCFSMVFVLWSLPNHTPIKYRCLIKKSNRIIPALLTGFDSRSIDNVLCVQRDVAPDIQGSEEQTRMLM